MYLASYTSISVYALNTKWWVLLARVYSSLAGSHLMAVFEPTKLHLRRNKLL